MALEPCMTSGASKASALAIEGPVWAGSAELYAYLLGKLRKTYGWAGVSLPQLGNSELAKMFDYAEYISTGPTSKTIYKNHILPLISRLHPDSDEIDMSNLGILDSFLYIIVRPEPTEKNMGLLHKTFGLRRETAETVTEAYVRAAKLAKLRYMLVETSLYSNTWKVMAYLRAKKRIGTVQ